MVLHATERAPRVRTPRPPLLVLLHGLGADEHDLLGLAGALDPRLQVVSLRAPHPYPVGWAWYHVDHAASPPRADLAQAEASRALLEREVPALQARLGADPARTFLLGFSQGAVLALSLALARPDLVRGVVLHSGRVLDGLAGRAPPAEALTGLEALVVHGAHDDVLPVARGREIRDLLAPLLGPRLTWREHPVGHEVTPETLADVAAWLAARI